MGLKHIDRLLLRHPRVAVDSMVFIYLLEDREPYAPLIEYLLERIELGAQTAYTSTLTLTEILTQPFRSKNYEVIHAYRQHLRFFPNLKILPLTQPIAEFAASLRAQYGLRTPDAIQLGTAIEHGATLFLTNDKQLRRVKEIQVQLLSDWLPD